MFKQGFVDWIEDPDRGFYVANTWNEEKNIMGGSGNLTLFPHQVKILSHVLDFDPETGRFPYTTVVYSCPKKSGKTAMGAAVGCWFAENAPPATEIYCLANDLEQSAGRVFRDMTYHFENSGDTKNTKYLIERENKTFIQALAQSYRSSAGSRQALTLWDELWGYNSELARRLWDEMQPVPIVPYSLRFITTYAGFYGESDLLWDIYTKGVGLDEYKDGLGEPVPELEGLPCYRNGRLFVYWDHDGRMPWQTDEYYDEAFANERGTAYLRLHENRWVRSTETFMPVEWWDEAVNNAKYDIKNEEGKLIEQKNYEGSALVWKGHPYYDGTVFVAVDAGIKRDCTAAVGVTYDTKRGKLVLLFHKIWTPTEEHPVDLDHSVEPWLREVCREFKVKEIAFDPTHVLQMKKRLEDDGIRVYEFAQSGKGMSEASQLLFDLFHDQNFLAYKADDLREHFQNAIAEQTNTGLRIVKDKSTRRKAAKKIDGVIALAMACHRAVENTRLPMQPIQHIRAPFSDLAGPVPMQSQEHLPFALRTDI